jgi:uncharacterized UPF0160 family protein
MQTIITHSGNFHPDDVLAVATVQLYLGKEDSRIIRTRDQDEIIKGDWVIDVGGVFNPDEKRFDHHQKDAPNHDNGIPYSSFGMVWDYLGKEIAGSEFVAELIKHKIVFPIDAGDNAIKVCEISENGLVPFEFYDVIDTFKPVWGSEENYDSAFFEAVEFATFLITRLIKKYNANIKKFNFIESIYDNSEDKRFLVFDALVNREDLVPYREVMVIVSPSSSVECERWVAAPVPVEGNDFEHRGLFPKTWAGLVDEELEAVSGIEGAIFCHKNRYMFVGKTKDAAIAAANQLIKETETA